MWFRRSPSVTLNALAVPARNASTLGKLKSPVPSREVLVEEVPVLASKLDGVPAARDVQRVHEDVGGVVSALRELHRTAEVQATRDEHLRQPDRALDAVADAEVRRIERGGRHGPSAQRAAAEPRFVHEPSSEHVGFADGQNAATGIRCVAEPGDGVAVRRRLLRIDVILTVEEVQAAVRAEILLEIERPAIGVDDGLARARRTAGCRRCRRSSPGESARSRRRITGSVIAARCGSLRTRLFMSRPCRCLKPS